MIKIQQLDKTYDTGAIRVDALRNVDFSVNQGEFVSIMGPSGSGKSTLMNIIGCLDRPTAGTYQLDDVDLQHLDEKQLSEIRNQKIGFIFQTFNLLPRLDARRNVELPLLYTGVDPAARKQRALEALEWVGLADRARHRPNELSGGQRQRVAIARALVNNPVILLADEPTGNLDTQSGYEVMQLFQELHGQGSTIVLVTHEEEIALHSQRIIHFRDGRLVRTEQVDAPLQAGDLLTQYLKEKGEQS